MACPVGFTSWFTAGVVVTASCWAFRPVLPPVLYIARLFATGHALARGLTAGVVIATSGLAE